MKAHTYKRGGTDTAIRVPVSEKLIGTMLFTLHDKHGVGAVRARRFFEQFEFNFIKISGEVARNIDEHTSDTLNLLRKKNIHIAHIQEKALKGMGVGKYKFQLDTPTIADIAMLRSLIEVFNFGRERCMRFYEEINDVAEEFRNRYRSGHDDGHYEVMYAT